MTNGGSQAMHHRSAWDSAVLLGRRAGWIALVALGRLGDWLWVDAPRRRRAKVVVAGLFFAWLGYMLVPAPHDDPTQDTCDFGEVTRERYLEFLAFAQDKVRRGDWGPLPLAFAPGAEPGPEVQPHSTVARRELKRRFEEVARSATTRNEFGAAVHAAARAMGARLETRLNRYWFSTNPESNTWRFRAYRIRPGYFGLHWPSGWPEIVVSFADDMNEDKRIDNNEMQFKAIQHVDIRAAITGMEKFDFVTPLLLMREPPWGKCPVPFRFHVPSGESR